MFNSDVCVLCFWGGFIMGFYILVGLLEDFCDLCGIFYDCVLFFDVCLKSIWKVVMFLLLMFFVCFLLLGVMLFCMI